MTIKDSTIIITGGASGIGRIMTRIALEKGAKAVAIWDINDVNIESTVREFSPLGKVKGYKVDVSSSQQVEDTYSLVTSELGPVDIVIQCAGIITSNRTFDKNTIEEIDRTMKINAIAPMYVGHAALQQMVERDRGHIVTIASAAGTLPCPKMSIYTSSKWAAIGWSDSVRIELGLMKSNVKITTVFPYYINTGMFEGINSKIFPILDPEKTSKKIIKAIEKDKIYAGIPFSMHFIRFMEGILPTSWFDWIFGQVFGLYTVMDHYTGRK